MAITVERTGNALVLREPGSDEQAAAIAGALPEERHRTAVVVGASAWPALARLDPWLVADLDEQVDTGVRLLAAHASTMTAGEVSLARRLADRLGVEVVAPDGDLYTLADGHTFASGLGWVAHGAGSDRRPIGHRFPEPWWQGYLPAGHEQIPLGIWVRTPGGPAREDDPLRWIQPDPERPTVVVGAPGEQPPTPAAVVEVLDAFPQDMRGRVVLACYGSDIAQAVARERGAAVRALHGLPSTHGLVHLDTDGHFAWYPFAVESVYRPGCAPVLDRWVAPMPSLAMFAPARYRLTSGWSLDVLARGLLARPDTLQVDPALLTPTGPTPELLLACGATVPAAVLAALTEVLDQLPDSTKSALTVVPTTPGATLAARTLTAHLSDTPRPTAAPWPEDHTQRIAATDIWGSAPLPRVTAGSSLLTPDSFPYDEEPPAPAALPRTTGTPLTTPPGVAPSTPPTPATATESASPSTTPTPSTAAAPRSHPPAPQLKPTSVATAAVPLVPAQILPAEVPAEPAAPSASPEPTLWPTDVATAAVPPSPAQILPVEVPAEPAAPSASPEPTLWPTDVATTAAPPSPAVVLLADAPAAAVAAPLRPTGVATAAALPLAAGVPLADVPAAPSAAPVPESGLPPTGVSTAAALPLPSAEPAAPVPPLPLAVALSVAAPPLVVEGLLAGVSAESAAPSVAPPSGAPLRPTGVSMAAALPLGAEVPLADVPDGPAAPLATEVAEGGPDGVSSALSAGASASLPGVASSVAETPLVAPLPLSDAASSLPSAQPGSVRPPVSIPLPLSGASVSVPVAVAPASPVPTPPAARTLPPLAGALAPQSFPASAPADARSTEAQRRAVRAALGTKYDSATRAVVQLLAERPGLRASGDHAALLTELAVVRVFAEEPGAYDAAFHTCLTSGLRRLPTMRGVVVTGSQRVNHQEGARFSLTGPMLAVAAVGAAVPGDTELLIWTTTARRLEGLLDADRRNDVVLAAHTSLRVLAVEDNRLLLAEEGAPTERALTNLRAAATARAAVDIPHNPNAARWFGALPAA